MKKQILFAFLLFLSATVATAQSPVVLQPEHITMYSATNKFISELNFMYDEHGVLLGLFESSSNTPLYTCRYDEQMRLKECELNLGRSYAELHQFEYCDGKLSETFEWFHDPREPYYWEPIHHWIPVYDEEGRIVGDSFYQLSGGYPPGTTMPMRWTTSITYENSQEISIWSEYQTTRKRMTKTFDEFGHITSLLTEQLINGDYTNVTLDEYHYANGFLCGVETKKWEQQEWVNHQEVAYTRNSSGWILSTTYRSWNGTEYVDGRRTSYERNAEGYPTSLVFQKHTVDGWVDGSNPIYNPFTGLHSIFRDTLFNNYEHLAIQQQILGTAHAGIKRMDITYTPTPYPTYSNPDENDFSFSCLPNPTNGEITVKGKDLKSVEIYNVHGYCVSSSEIQGLSITLNLSGQPAGIYLVKITDKKDQKCVKKVVKE